MACGPSTKKFKQSVLSFGILKNTCSQSSDSETPVVIEASNPEQASSGGHEVSDSISRLARVPTQMTKTLNSKVATESSEVQQTNAIEMIECIDAPDIAVALGLRREGKLTSEKKLLHYIDAEG